MYAEARGIIDFSTCDGSNKWWLATRMRIRTAKRLIDAEIAKEGKAKTILKPWTGNGFGIMGEDDLDLMARWYIINAPQRLQELGVDFGSEPLSTAG